MIRIQEVLQVQTWKSEMEWNRDRKIVCVQTSPPPSGKNRERGPLSRFLPEGGGEVCTQANRKTVRRTYRKHSSVTHRFCVCCLILLLWFVFMVFPFFENFQREPHYFSGPPLLEMNTDRTFLSLRLSFFRRKPLWGGPNDISLATKWFVQVSTSFCLFFSVLR